MHELINPEHRDLYADFTLPRTARNEILTAIRSAELQPQDFEWQEVHSRPSHQNRRVSRLFHGPTGSFFVFGFKEGRKLVRGGKEPDAFPIIARPGFQRPVGEQELFSLDDQVTAVKRWIERVAREDRSPDLWAFAASEQQIIHAVSDVDGGEFSEQERERVVQQIAEFREYVAATVSLDSETWERVDRKLDYLMDATKRLGRRDWIGVAIGVVFTIMFEHPDVAAQSHSIFGFFLQSIARAMNIGTDLATRFLP